MLINVVHSIMIEKYCIMDYYTIEDSWVDGSKSTFNSECKSSRWESTHRNSSQQCKMNESAIEDDNNSFDFECGFTSEFVFLMNIYWCASVEVTDFDLYLRYVFHFPSIVFLLLSNGTYKRSKIYFRSHLIV